MAERTRTRRTPLDKDRQESSATGKDYRTGKLNPKKIRFKGAEKIQKLGFIIGLHTTKISDTEINFIKNCLFLIDKT